MTRTTLRAALLTGACLLAATGCRDKSEATSADLDVEVPGMSEAMINSHFDVDRVKVPAADAEAALASLGLAEKTERMTWASREGADGTYTYSDVSVTGEAGATTTIETLTLTNLAGGANPTLGKAEAKGIVIRPAADSGETGELKVASAVVVEPDMDAVRSLLSGDGEADLPDARAFSISGVDGNIADDEATGTLSVARIAFADPKSATSRDGFMLADDIEMDVVVTENGAPMDVKLSLDDFSVAGLADLGMFSGDMSALSQLSGASNPASLPFTQASLDDLDITADTLVFDMEGFKAVYEEKGDVVTGLSKLEPIVMKFTGEPTVPQIASLYENLGKLGYDELVMTGGGKSKIDLGKDTAEFEDNYFELQDGMRMEFDYTMTGVKAVQDAQAAAMAELGEAPGPNADPADQYDYEARAMQASMAGLDQIRIADMEISLDDNSIMERVFEMAAADQGTSAKALRMQAKGMLAMGTMMSAGSGIDEAIVADIVEALGEFIDNPGSKLVISMDPDAPVGMDGLASLTKESAKFDARVER